MKPVSLTQNTVILNGKPVAYLLRFSERAKRRRITASPKGIEVILPQGDKASEVVPFLQKHATWVLRQLAKREASSVTTTLTAEKLPFLFRGVVTKIEVVESAVHQGAIRVEEKTGCLVP